MASPSLHGTDMGELREHQPAFLMHGIRERLIAGHDPVIDVDQRQSVCPDLGPHDRRCPSDLHAKACAGSLAVIVDVAFAGQPTLGEAGLMGRKIDSRAQRLAVDLQGLGDGGECPA